MSVDLDRVLAEEAAGEADGWKIVKTSDIGEVWKKSVSDSPVHLVKVLPLENRVSNVIEDLFVGIFEVTRHPCGRW